MKRKTFYTVEQVAEHLHLNITTVYRLARAGDLPAFKVGGQWRFERGLLEEWMREQIAESSKNKKGKK